MTARFQTEQSVGDCVVTDIGREVGCPAAVPAGAVSILGVDDVAFVHG